MGFPSPQVRVEERRRASSGRRNFPGDLVTVVVCLVTFLIQLSVCLIKGVRWRGHAVQIDQLTGFLTGLGCSAAVLGEAQEAVKAKAKPRVVPAAEHSVFVLKDKW